MGPAGSRGGWHALTILVWPVERDISLLSVSAPLRRPHSHFLYSIRTWKMEGRPRGPRSGDRPLAQEATGAQSHCPDLSAVEQVFITGSSADLGKGTPVLLSYPPTGEVKAPGGRADLSEAIGAALRTFSLFLQSPDPSHCRFVTAPVPPLSWVMQKNATIPSPEHIADFWRVGSPHMKRGTPRDGKEVN